jgi:membrane protease YdiL (CAAX protease family)
MQDVREDFGEDDENGQPGRDVIIVLIVFFEAGLAPFALLLGWIFGHPPLEHFRWRLADVGFGALASLPMIGFVIVLLRWPIGPFRKIRKLCDEEVIPLLGGSDWYELVMIAMSAGVGEEMLFRGVIQTSLVSWLARPALGLVLASLFFGLLHPVSLAYIAVATVLGTYLGWLLIYNGNLLSVIVAHALYDLAALGYLLKWPPAFLGRPDPVE